MDEHGTYAIQAGAVQPWQFSPGRGLRHRHFAAKAHAAKTSHVFHLREGKVVDLPDFTRRTSAEQFQRAKITLVGGFSK